MSGGSFTPTHTIRRPYWLSRESIGLTLALFGAIIALIAFATAGIIDHLGGNQMPYLGVAGGAIAIAFIGLLLWGPKKR